MFIRTTLAMFPPAIASSLASLPSFYWLAGSRYKLELGQLAIARRFFRHAGVSWWLQL